MNVVKLIIHSTGIGTDSLSGKSDVDGLTVTFEDGTVKESFLSWKSFKQICNLKLPAAQPKIPTATPVIGSVTEPAKPNGNAVSTSTK